MFFFVFFICWVVDDIRAYVARLSFVGIYFISDLLYIFMWVVLAFRVVT